MDAKQIKELLKGIQQEENIPKGEFRTADLVASGMSESGASTLIRKL